MDHPLRSEREKRGLTITDLAERAGVNEKSVRRAEAFDSISGDTKIKIADALSVAVSSIWPVASVGAVVVGPSGAARIVGRTGSGGYALEPLSFGQVTEVSESELKARFAVDLVAAGVQSERHGFTVLAETSRRNAADIERAQQRAAADQARVHDAEEAGWAAIATTMDEIR